MNHHDPKSEALDRAIESIRNGRLDPEHVADATARSWTKIARGIDAPLSSCADFSASIPALVAGELSPARALLVEDHARGCVTCRRSLLEARGEVAVPPPAMARIEGRGVPGWLGLAAAAVLAVGLGALGFVTVGNVVADSRLTATIATFGDDMQLVDGTSTTALSDGSVIRSHQILRAPSSVGAEVVLADGSVVEMAPRSELELAGSRRGATVRLRRGNIIVRAAEQHGGRLFVATDDCRVAVRGTVFAVDHGFKGSRVSVIEGEVEVRRAGRTDVLAPGQQVTTNERLRTVPIEEQVAWSPHSDRHVALLRELTTLRRELADAIEPRTPRTSSRLLTAVPGDTAIYVALPNLAEGLADARRVLADRLISNPVLADWWSSNVVAHGVDREVDAVLDRLQDLGRNLGDEVVIAVPASGLADAGGGPVVLAALRDGAAFRSIIADELARTSTAETPVPLELVDSPEEAAASSAELLLWVVDDVVVAATSPEQLVAAAALLASPADTAFTQSDLYTRLAAAYENGISWVLGVDMAAVMDRATAASGDDEAAFIERLGLSDATSAVIGYSREGDHRNLSGGLYFDGERRGMAAWLERPAPMGSLDFVSPQASVAAAAVTKEGAVVYDELVAAIAEIEPGADSELAQLEDLLGLDLRADLAATFGGEVAFAVDGPLLPTPSWKLIVEVSDADTLRHTIRQLVAEANRLMEEHDRPGLELVESERAGRIYSLIRHRDGGAEIAYAVVDGYLVVTPRPALIDDAIRYRDTGVTLPRSAPFRELLPDDGHTGCSALAWKNLADVLASVPPQMLEQLPVEAGMLLDEGAEPGLWCAYAFGDRILASGSGTGLVSSVPLAGLLGLTTRPDARTEIAGHPLSSGG